MSLAEMSATSACAACIVTPGFSTPIALIVRADRATSQRLSRNGK
jgi:hypothetical protein